MNPEINALNRDTIVDFIGSIFDRRGGEEYLGEPVTMGEHMLQGATIAEQNGQSEEIIVAALLHDIGILPDALLADYHLGEGQDGLALVRQLRARDPALPARLMSANRSTELRQMCDAAQTVLMTKPINTEDLEDFLYSATMRGTLTPP